MALFTCRGLARRPWFEGWDLTLGEGEIVALAGPSGSGKTLCLRALADLDPADAGKLHLRGAERASMSGEAWRAQVLYVHQRGVRLPGTVAENLARIADLSAQREAVSSPPPPVPGLDPSADAERLSGGEAQALALHRALMCRPAILLLDEATSAMDPETAAYWEGTVRSYAGAGPGVIWVAHDTALAARVGARQERFP